MYSSPLIEKLVDAFRCLPGVGPKSAQRMALYLLERNTEGGKKLSAALEEAIEKVGKCNSCHTLTEFEICNICSSPSRNKRICCVVESPADVYALEQTGTYRGVYFVLMGHLSPIDGVGPEQLGIDRFLQLVDEYGTEEIIIACNPTVEGEATAYFIAEQLRGRELLVSRIAHGVPVGGELEYIDGGTLSHAMSGRKPMNLD